MDKLPLPSNVATLGDFEIAPGFKASRWNQLEIQSGTRWSPDWEKAVGVFEKRINARFINQIKVLITNRDQATAGFCGFAVVALDCLLIETLDQFYNGNHTTRRKSTKDDDPDIKAFHDVFHRSSILRNVFDALEKTKVFYQQIRCGLLHQAQTKGDSKINRRIDTAVKWCDPANPRNGLVVHPCLFHECVEQVYADYLTQLRNRSNGNLRSRFRKKMNRIAAGKKSTVSETVSESRGKY
ncbi:MAG TPA: hypothetical protein VGO59_11690 [Verrucomicrobiae bacterium]|jgi:hypothetical protein